MKIIINTGLIAPLAQLFSDQAPIGSALRTVAADLARVAAAATAVYLHLRATGAVVSASLEWEGCEHAQALTAWVAEGVPADVDAVAVMRGWRADILADIQKRVTVTGGKRRAAKS